MSKLKDERFLKKILFIFLGLQPILDCYLLYTDTVIEIFKFSPTTIIRMLLISFLFAILFINKSNKKERKLIYTYGIIIVIYSALHHLVAVGIDNSVFSSFSYGIITELFYIIRLLLPIAMIYIAYSLKPTKEEVIKLFLTVSLVVGIISVGTNLLVLAKASYGNGFIKGNVFDWFLNTSYGFHELASKGWFNSANQIGGLFFILLPVCIYSIFEKLNWPRAIITSLLILSMIMLGTRVASYGWLLISIMMAVLYLFFAFILKNLDFKVKNFMAVIGIVILSVLVMNKAPIVNNNLSHNEKTKEELKQMKDDNISTKELLQYIGMNEIYYEHIYPYEEHKDFWEYVVDDVSPEDRVGNRNSQKLITLDVAKNFENVSSMLLGLGYSRFINAELYLEMDFAIHYFTVGVVGIVLFLLPYIVISIICFVLCIKNKKFNLFNTTMLAMLCLPLLVSIFSGHIMDELIVTLFLGFIAGFMLYNVGGMKYEES